MWLSLEFYLTAFLSKVTLLKLMFRPRLWYVLCWAMEGQEAFPSATDVSMSLLFPSVVLPLVSESCSWALCPIVTVRILPHPVAPIPASLTSSGAVATLAVFAFPFVVALTSFPSLVQILQHGSSQKGISHLLNKEGSFAFQVEHSR